MRKLLGLLLLLPLSLAAQLPSASIAPVPPRGVGRYANPLPIQLPDGSNIVSCPDPSIIRSETPGDNAWYMYCTNEVFHDNGLVHLMAISRSTDLAHWTYVTDVFPVVPSFLPVTVGLWAPDIQFMNGKYYLYYAASQTQQGGPAIFVATSNFPDGPFSAIATPVVPPEKLADGSWRDVIDPAMATENGQSYILYGSFNGGTQARLLTDDALGTIPGSEVQLSPPNRYEASYVIQRQDYYYLFLSAGTCCAGAGSGYGVYVARSPHVLGPYLDKDGVSLTDTNVGGTPVILMNGNRWLGPGHNAVVTDPSGQDWMLYHAVDGLNPTIPEAWTRRPAMLDPIDWSDGWPSVRSGAGASDQLEPAPATSPDAALITDPTPAQESMGAILSSYTDEFEASKISTHWSWLHPSVSGTFGPQNGALFFATQAGDMTDTLHNAPLLSEATPSGDFIVETKLSNNLPENVEHNSIESGIVLYQDDTHFLKLTMQAIGSTRQLEFAIKNGSTWGRAYLASAAPETWLRIARHGAVCTSYSSHDGVTWTRGPSWQLATTSKARVALISAGGTGYLSRFEYVRVGERQ
jgi:arabinan endo-1,5-alpha-L-arabinosidase